MPLRTLIVIPTYNERETVESIVQAVRASTPAATIMVVDDNSPDGTGAIADALAAADDHVKVMHREAKAGLGAAYKAAFDRALSEGWDIIVQMDSDFSHDPGDVPRLLDAIEAGADLAIGSRYVPGGGTENWGVGRRMISRGGSFYARSVLGVHISDLTGGFKAWRASTLRGIKLQQVQAVGYGFQIEMTFRTLRNGFKVVEIPIRFADRRVGQSKMSGTIFVEALALVWKLRASIRPGRG